MLRVRPGQALQRQPQPQRRIARDQEHHIVAEEPFAALPDALAIGDNPAQRQHAARRRCQPLAKHFRQPRPLKLVAKLGFHRHHVRRQPLLPPQIVVDILIRLVHQPRIHLQPFRQRAREQRRIRRCRVVLVIVARQQFRVLPHRLAVRPPVRVDRPARQLLTRIMLAHVVGQRRALAPQRRQLADQPPGELSLCWPQSINIPLQRLKVRGRDKSRLAAHGQAHVALGQRAVHRRTLRQNILPHVLRIRLGHPRRLGHAGYLHLKVKFRLALAHQPGNRRRRRRRRRRRQRNMPLAGHQSGGRVQPDPARTRQINLRPGMQIRKI